MNGRFIYKVSILLFLVILVGFAGIVIGFNTQQTLALSAFSFTILGALFFWQFRLSFAFVGSAILLFARIVELNEFIIFSSMDIILFLIGMMILISFLKEIGLFNWMLERALCIQNMTARKLMVVLVCTSALMACLVDEVSSIIFMIMVIFELSDYFEVDPVPFIIASVLATNIGSTGTVLGNPIGLFIAAKASLTFEDFITHAFPLMIATLLVLLGVLFLLFKKPLNELDEKIKRFGSNEFLARLLNVPPPKKLKIGFMIAGITWVIIALHHRLELLLNLETNTILLIAPLLSASIIMVWRRQKAREYVEHGVEWWTLLFFMFLFAQAGTLGHIGVAEVLADRLSTLVAGNQALLTGFILIGGAFTSAFLDNVIVVSALIPIIKSLGSLGYVNGGLWWALLFGGCLGGNITMIGSTANIIAIGILEKDRKKSISFLKWLKIGLIVGVITILFVLIILLSFPYYK